MPVLLIHKLTEEKYNMILNSGMFWEFYPDLSGIYEQDRYKIQCKNFNRYKGIKKPKCNNSNPCYACRMKYKITHNTIKNNETSATDRN